MKQLSLTKSSFKFGAIEINKLFKLNKDNAHIKL